LNIYIQNYIEIYIYFKISKIKVEKLVENQ
jgi:hypothetical protein